MTTPDGARRVLDVRRTRRHPSPRQHDYLHLRRLLDDLIAAFARLPTGPLEVLDVYCGARPYEDLLPPGSRVTGLDVVDDFGVADVVSDEFLPFEDGRFDLVLCSQAFYYVPDPAHAATEFRRILRPGGTVVITVPHVQEYERQTREHRFTAPELASLFADWSDVVIRESGGRAVTWTTITGRMVLDVSRALSGRRFAAPPVAAVTPLCFVVLNGAGLLLERLDRRVAKPGYTLPCNLLISARAPELAGRTGPGLGSIGGSPPPPGPATEPGA